MCNDASLKTDTCKVPEYDSGVTLISYRVVVQVAIIQYTFTNMNVDDTEYRFPIIYAYGTANPDIPTYRSIVISKNPGSIESSDIYQITRRPITCRYWYI